MRAGNQGHLYFYYSNDKQRVVENVSETNKLRQQKIIDNLRQNYE